MEIKIIVATHKPYWMPEDPLYLPLLVGAEGKEIDWQGEKDNTGENISRKNPHYCELTGLYWAWKNLNADILGLVHYRRYFSRRFGKKEERLLDSGDVEVAIQGKDLLLPKKRHYWIETNYSQYVHAHHAVDLERTREILQEKYPEYVPAFDRSMKKRCGHRFNMFIMRKDTLDEYCAWLFDILFELERRLDISEYNDVDRRVFGYVSERLLDVWLMRNEISYKDIPYIFLEKQNWVVKIANFLKRKLGGTNKGS